MSDPVVVVQQQPFPIVQILAPTRTTVIVDNENMAGPPGPLGPQGPSGNPGPTGATGPPGDGSFFYEQTAPSATWTIVHNMGYRPGGVSVIDSAGSNVEGNVLYPDANTVVVEFSSGFAGVAYLS